MSKDIERQVIDIVSRHFGVKKKTILSHSRHKRTARDNLARQIVLYCLREFFSYTQEGAASVLSYSSHGSVQHAVEKIKDELTWNVNVRQCINQVEELREEYV